MKKPYHGLCPAAGAALGAALYFFLPSAARAADHRLLSAHVPAAVANLKVTGTLANTNRLHLAIGLPVSDQAGLNKFLQDVYDPASPNYHHYLSVDEFADKFGPSKADYEALRAFAKANGLAEVHAYPNRMVLSVEGSAAAINKALHVNIQTYQHPTENREFYAPDREPTIDLAIPVLHIQGLDNYQLPQPVNYKLPVQAGRPFGGGSNSAPFNGTGPGGTYISQDFRNAYVPGVTLTGTGQSAALFEYDGYFNSDILEYEQQTGLPNVNLVNVPIDGGVIAPGGASVEVSLDIEMVMAIAPGISTIYVYESPGGPPDDMLSRMTTDNLAKQFSSSWGFGGDPTTDQLFQEMAAQGQTMFQASGDTGAFYGAGGPGNFGPYSGESPYFTLVGGTELEMNGAGSTYATESVWGTGQYQPGNWGSSGGICTFYPLPSYQANIDMTANHGSTIYRNSPDVSLTADNIWIVYYNGQTGGSGGTSAAAPLWCGFNALVNQQAALYRLASDGFINPAVYAIGKGANYYNCFHDVTVGNNSWPGLPTNYPAVAGYDLCTGWGSPTGINLINALAPPLNIPVLLVVTNIVSGGNGNGIIDFDECNNVTFLITNAGNAGATGIRGFLSSTTPGAIVAQSSVNFPDLPAGTAAYSTASFTLSTSSSFVCGTPINLSLTLKTDQLSATNSVVLPSGIVGPPNVFTNETSILIPQGNLTGIFSPVTVSGLQAAAKITVSVYAGVQYDEGLNLELISPNGTKVALTAYPNGYLGANYGAGCSSNLQTTFDDAALTPIANGTAPFIGSYQPKQALSTLLPAFGTNLNGVWQLNAVEEFTGDPSELFCWSLNVQPYVCQDGGGQCPGSDLSLSMTVSPNPVLVFSNAVYNLTVSNAGPSPAQAVVISQALPPGFVFVQTSNYPVVVTPGSNMLLSLGSLPVYGSATVSVVALATVPGPASSVATVGLTGTDPNLANNAASALTVVSLPTADLAVTMSASPPALLQGGTATYTIIVTNNGPFAATGVVLTNVLPANVIYLSSTASQGAITLPGVQFDLGTLPVGSNAVVTVTVKPATTGNFTDTAQAGLGAGEADPVAFNNSASFTLTAGPSSDLGVSAIVTPATVIAGNNYTNIATIYNNGPNSANTVTFSQTIPGGIGLNAATFVSTSQSSNVTVANGIITWDIGNMASGATVQITNILKSPTVQSGGRPIVLSSTFSVFGQPGDSFTNNNVVILTNLDETPTVTVVPAGVTLVSEGNGFTNGAINPGETVALELYLQNSGNVPTTNLVGYLQPTGGVSLQSSSQNYGALTPGAAPVGGYFTFTATGTNGGTVVATLALQDGSANLGTAVFTFNLPIVQTFWNTNPIYIPALGISDTNVLPESGPAGPYPSTVTVSNMNGYVSKVTVTLSNLSHTYPHDIGLLLVGPATNTVLMDNAFLHATQPSVDVNILFDSTAGVLLPGQGNLTSGIYQPENYNPNDKFTNAVAPPGSTNALTGGYSANLASFNGSKANGVWALYAHDVAEGDSGGISNGWAVTITSITPVNPSNNLVATLVAATNPVVVGDYITNLLSVTNAGLVPVAAYLTNNLPTGLSFISAVGSPNGYTQFAPPIVIYNLGTLAAGAGLTITNVDQATGSGLETNTITAGLPFSAFNISSNIATAVTPVSLPMANLVVSIAATPTPPIVNSNITYTLSVTNLGPSNAVAASGSFVLTGAVSSSATTNLGVILPGTATTVTIVATPSSVGKLTGVWTVTSANSQNTNVSFPSSSSVLVVTNAVPVMVAAGASLLTPGGNGAVNSGQPVTVNFTLANQGTAPTANLIATLQASGGITPSTTSQSYGTIYNGSTGTQPFSFTATGAPGSTVIATLTLTNFAPGATSLGAVSFPFQIPVTTSFASSNFAASPTIVIPEFGPASPYPSTIYVSGLTNAQGRNLLVSKVTVTLNGFAHTYPQDVNALLASPSGQEMIFMEHVGGASSVSNVNLTFSDSGAASLSSARLTSGTYLPSDIAPMDVFPGLTATSGATNLSIFDGENPNGYWSLYVYDDKSGDAGSITGGWSLGLTAVSTVNPAALLSASMVSAPNPVLSGNYLTYQITVTNEGPDIANNVVITDALPSTVTFSAAALTQGSYVANNGTVVCSLGSIPNGGTVTATITVITKAQGSVINTATVSTDSSDLYLAASTTAIATTVDNSIFDLKATNIASGLQLTLLGQLGQSYVLQTSSNLVRWTPIFTNSVSLGNSSFIYTDGVTNAPTRFYRAIHTAQ